MLQFRRQFRTQRSIQRGAVVALQCRTRPVGWQVQHRRVTGENLHPIVLVLGIGASLSLLMLLQRIAAEGHQLR